LPAEGSASTELVQTMGDRLPCSDALFVSGDCQSTDTLCNKARSIVSVLAFNVKGAGPKLSIVREHRRSTPRLAVAHPSAGKALAHQLTSKRVPVARHDPELPAIMVLIAIRQGFQYNGALVKQIVQAGGCTLA